MEENISGVLASVRAARHEPTPIAETKQFISSLSPALSSETNIAADGMSLNVYVSFGANRFEVCRFLENPPKDEIISAIIAGLEKLQKQ